MLDVSAMNHGWLILLWVALFGACVGSFANVYCHRIPIMRRLGEHADGKQLQELVALHGKYTLSAPRSSCPACNAKIKGRYNIPVAGWFFARGKCSECATPISRKYPAVEAMFGIAFAGYVWFEGLSLAGSMSFIMMFAGFCSLMIRSTTGRFYMRLVGLYAVAFAAQVVLTIYGFSGYSHSPF